MLELTPRANRVFNIIAPEEARRLNHNEIYPEHLFLAILREGEGTAIQALKNLAINITQIRQEFEGIMGERSNIPNLTNGPFSTPYLQKVLNFATKEAENLGHAYIGTEHLLLALLREKGIVKSILEGKNITSGSLKNEIIQILNSLEMGMANARNIADRKGPILTKSPLLTDFAKDLTLLAKEGKLDPIVGRAKEIERIIQILSRRNKNNPVIIGESGVGKTAIVEGLASKIISGEVPEAIKNRRVLSIDLLGIVAGTKYRGEFEDRLKKIIKEIKKSGNVIVFIDELHTIIGAGSAEGTLDAANILKPELARGELQVIGATTLNEYKKYIEKDAALERRFQPIVVDEPTLEDAIQILHGIKEKYEAHHKIQYTDAALKSAVMLSYRYVNDRFLPDKAIDVIDEAGARIRLQNSAKPSHLLTLEEEMKGLQDQKDQCVKIQEFERAAFLRDQIKDLSLQLKQAEEEWKNEWNQNLPLVGEKEIAEIIAMTTGVPVTRINKDEGEKLLKLEEDLHTRIIGQEEPIQSIAKAIRRARAGVKSFKRPVGSFLFLGPTGVGKTELAKVLAEKVFDRQDALIRFDMSDFMEKHAVSRLVGSPPGYVGYEEGGILTEAVRRKPYSVILFDEVEKAHGDIFNILLQVMEEGELSDNLGHKVNFRNTIIIMTSNIGSRKLTKDKGNLGFSSSTENDNEKTKESIMEELKTFFNPEFLNRVDDMIVFHPLEKEQIKEIIDIMMQDLNKVLEERKLKLKISAEVKEFLADKGYDKKYGARPLRRTIQRYIEDPLSEELLRHHYPEGMVVLAELDFDTIVFKEKALESL